MRFFLTKIALFNLIPLVLTYVFGFSFFYFHGRNQLHNIVENNKSKLIVIGASNIGYNYDFNKLSVEFPKYSIYTISFSEPSGLFLLYDNLNRFKLTEKDILIWDLPHSFFEPDKYLPISQKSFILKYTKSSFIELFNQPYSINSIAQIPVSILKNWEYFGLNSDSLRDPITFQGEKVSKTIKNINLDVNKFYIKSKGLNKNYISFIKENIEKLKSKSFFWFPPVLINNFDIDNERLFYLKVHMKYLNTFDESKLDINYFFDQWYHLNSKGKSLNTDYLIKYLRKLSK